MLLLSWDDEFHNTKWFYLWSLKGARTSWSCSLSEHENCRTCSAELGEEQLLAGSDALVAAQALSFIRKFMNCYSRSSQGVGIPQQSPGLGSHLSSTPGKRFPDSASDLHFENFHFFPFSHQWPIQFWVPAQSTARHLLTATGLVHVRQELKPVLCMSATGS